MIEFNKNQNKAINELDRNILLLASAGTGKTNTLSYRIANILKENKAKADEILCLTFTNRACKEMEERVEKAIRDYDLEVEGEVSTLTFHSFCFDVIKKEFKNNTDIPFNFMVYDEEDSKEVIYELIKNYAVKMSGFAVTRIINYIKEKRLFSESDDYLEIINNIDDNLLEDFCRVKNFETGKKYLDENTYNFVKNKGDKLLKDYNNSLLENHALDFSDLTYQVKKLFENEEVVKRWKEKYKYILIDEVQDTSISEYKIISKLFGNNNIMMCGDVFQTIYEWRGSDPIAIFEEFEKDANPLKIILNISYRASSNISNFAFNYLIENFEGAKRIYSNDYTINSKEPGEKVKLKEFDNMDEEARWIYKEIQDLNIKDFSQVAILSRSNTVNEKFARVFAEVNSKMEEEKRLPFFLIDEFKFFRRKEVKDMLAYLKYISNRFDCVSFKRILKSGAYRVGDRTVEKIESPEIRELGIEISDFCDPLVIKDLDPFKQLVDELENDNVIVFDVESTGTDTSRDNIIQIAAVKIDKNGKVIDKFVKFLKSDKKVGTSENVHHFSDEYLEKVGEEPKKILTEFCAFIKDCILVGHNVTYDITILNSYLHRLNLEPADFLNYFDTLDLSRRFYPELKNHKLDTLSKKFEVEVMPTHDALNDILATKDVLIEIVNNKIKPRTLERIGIYREYIEKFEKINILINKFREVAKNQSITNLITLIVKNTNLQKLEDKHLENLRKLYVMAKENDESTTNNTDSLNELLKFTALSSSELDTLIKSKPKIPIITVHQAKGLEFKYVFLVGLHSSIFPSYLSVKEGRIAEEKRLFYVALTRAKTRLTVTASHKNLNYREMNGKSEFFENLKKISVGKNWTEIC